MLNGVALASVMIRFICFLILICPVITGLEESNESNCFKVKDYFWKHLSTKTPYRYVANVNDSKIEFENCVPKKIWMVVRHGTRYPSTKLINKIRIKLPEIRDAIIKSAENEKSNLCSNHVNNLTLWTPQIDLENEKRLTHEGEDEMIDLAERFQNRFPSLFPSEYTNSSYQFRCTATERTQQSRHYFLVGLFGRKMAHHVWSSEPIYKDPILRFYKLCPKWLKEVHKNPKASFEAENFKSSKLMQTLIDDVSSRLGLKEKLSFDDLEVMFMTCSYESAWNRVSPSPWCSVFTEKEMEIMEYVKDLKHYWADGYGHDINFKQACPLMEDLLQNLRSEEGPTATVYFTHSGTILKFLSHLGLYYDEFKLTRDKFSQPRLWKVGYIDSFGSNLAFVSFQCGNELKLLSMHQERPVKLPGCPKEGLCKLDKLLKTYRESLHNCKFSELCSRNVGKT